MIGLRNYMFRFMQVLSEIVSLACESWNDATVAKLSADSGLLQARMILRSHDSDSLPQGEIH